MAREEKKSIVASIKDRMEKAKKGANGGGKLFYLKDGQKRRVRFVNDMEDAVVVSFHSVWQSYNHPCLKYYGKSCEHCADSDARHDDWYVWTVYDYESKKRGLFMYKANEKSPVPYMVEFYGSYGTIVDRDYTLSRTGTSFNTSYKLVPLDKTKFKVKDVKPFTKKEIFEILKEEFDLDEMLDDSEDADEDELADGYYDDDEDEAPKKKKSKKSKKPVDDDEDEDEDDIDDDDEDEEDEEPPKKKKKAASKKKKKVVEEDDEDEDEEDDDDDEDELHVKKKKKKYDDDDLDDDDDEDEDDDDYVPPKKKKKKARR